jgi:signal peptidase I
MKIAIRVLFAVVVVTGLAAAVLLHTTYRVYAVQTGSMTPTIPAKSLVVVEAGHYKMGEPITFRVGNGVVTHRLVADNGDGTFSTKGDANNVADLTPVAARDIIGGVVAYQPELGFWWLYATRPVGAASIAVSLLLLYLIWSLFTATSKPEPAPLDLTDPRDPERTTDGIAPTTARGTHHLLTLLPGDLAGPTPMLADIWGLDFLHVPALTGRRGSSPGDDRDTTAAMGGWPGPEPDAIDLTERVSRPRSDPAEAL